MFKSTLVLFTLAALLQTTQDAQAQRVRSQQKQSTTKQVSKSKSKVVKRAAVPKRPRRKMTKLAHPVLTTFGLRKGSLVRADPTIGQVKGAQSGMTLTYKVQGKASERASTPSVKGKSSRGAYSSAEQWQTVITDKVGAHDSTAVHRISEISEKTVPVGTPFRVSGVRNVTLRPNGKLGERTLMNKTNTTRGFATALGASNKRAEWIHAPGPEAWKGLVLFEGRAVTLKGQAWSMDSQLAGTAKPFFVEKNFGISAPRNLDKNGVGTVSLLNFAAVPQGSTVRVSNVNHREYLTSFVAGARGANGATNRAQIKAAPGQRLRVDVSLPNGQVVTNFIRVPARGNLGKVLVKKTSRGKGRYSPRYFRAQTAKPINSLRVSPPMACKGCGVKGDFVSVRVPENLLSGSVKVTNLTTGHSETINVSKTDQINIKGSLNDRLHIEGPGIDKTVFVPGARDGKLLERGKAGRPYFEIKPAPER